MALKSLEEFEKEWAEKNAQEALKKQESEKRIMEHIEEVRKLRFDALTDDDLYNLCTCRVCVGRTDSEDDKIAEAADIEWNQRNPDIEISEEELAIGILDGSIRMDRGLSPGGKVPDRKWAIETLERIAKERGLK